jgi:hypothetical protein
MSKKIVNVLLFLVLLTGCSTNNEDSNLTEKIDTLTGTITSLQDQITVLKDSINNVNIYGNGVYYCANHAETFESIEFVSANVIRVYIADYNGGEISPAANSYFKVASTEKGVFTLTEDIVLSDTFGSYSMTDLKAGWDANANDFLKTIEVSQDHQTLYYGSNHSTSYCKFNQKID